MNNEVLNLVSMMKGIIAGNSPLVSHSLRYLLPGIIFNLQSIIAAPHLKDVFIDLAFCAFNADETKKTKVLSKVKNDRIKLSDSFIKAIAFYTLRKLRPKCIIDDAWLKEDIGRFNNITVFVSLYKYTIRYSLIYKSFLLYFFR